MFESSHFTFVPSSFTACCLCELLEASDSINMSDNMRARKSGIGADIERKLEERYDKEEADGTTNAILIWLNASLQGEHDTISSYAQRDLHRSLKDGVMLCKLINKLLLTDGKAKISFQKKCASPFVAMGNIENFNKGCIEYGLAKEFLFQSADLWEGRKGPFLNVVNCVHSLGFLANSKGFQPTYTGEQTKYIDNE